MLTALLVSSSAPALTLDFFLYGNRERYLKQLDQPTSSCERMLQLQALSLDALITTTDRFIRHYAASAEPVRFAFKNRKLAFLLAHRIEEALSLNVAQADEDFLLDASEQALAIGNFFGYAPSLKELQQLESELRRSAQNLLFVRRVTRTEFEKFRWDLSALRGGSLLSELRGRGYVFPNELMDDYMKIESKIYEPLSDW